MADPKKYFQFNVTSKLGVTPNQIHQNVRRKQIIQTLTDISDKKVKSAKQKAKTSAISKINYSSYGEGNSRGLSARKEFKNLNAYTTNQFYNPKSDIAKTHIGYSIELPLETRQKLIQYQKQDGKFEQRQRVLDRLNSKQQFKNGGTLTQFLLKEGKL